MPLGSLLVVRWQPCGGLPQEAPGRLLLRAEQQPHRGQHDEHDDGLDGAEDPQGQVERDDAAVPGPGQAASSDHQ